MLDGDVGAFRESRAAERAGKPLEKVELDAKEAKQAGLAVPTSNRKLREQARINEYERKIAETAQEAKALREELAAARAAKPVHVEEKPAVAAVPQPTTADALKAEAKRIMALPGAPQLEDYDGLADFGVAQQLFMDSVRAHESAVRANREAAGKALEATYTGFASQLDQARTKDPEFVNKLTPEVKALKGVQAAIAAKEAVGPLNFVAENLYESQHVAELCEHFSLHPDALHALIALPPSLAALPDTPARAQAHVKHINREFAKLEGRLEASTTVQPAQVEDPPSPPTAEPLRTISAAPPPAPILTRPGQTTDPLMSAIKSNNFGAFRELRAAERAAKRSA